MFNFLGLKEYSVASIQAVREGDLLTVLGWFFSTDPFRNYWAATDIRSGLHHHVFPFDLLRTADRVASPVHNKKNRRCGLLRPGRFAGSQ